MGEIIRDAKGNTHRIQVLKFDPEEGLLVRVEDSGKILWCRNYETIAFYDVDEIIEER